MENQKQTVLKEKQDNRFEELKRIIEELELQLSLGLADAIDKLEEHKINLKNFIGDAREVFNSLDELSKEYTPNLRQKFDELLLQLSLGKAESQDILEDQKDKILNSLNGIEKHLKNNDYDEKILTFLQSLGLKTEKLRSFIEITRLKYALGKEDIKDELEKNKIDLEKKVHEIKNQIDKNMDENKYPNLKQEISDLFNHIKRVGERLK